MDGFTRKPVSGLPYGTPSPPGSQPYADYEEVQAALRLEMDACRYCRTARRRAGERWDERQARGGWQNYSREGSIERAGCKRHVERRRLNYVCSPVSETYWAS